MREYDYNNGEPIGKLSESSIAQPQFTDVPKKKKEKEHMGKFLVVGMIAVMAVALVVILTTTLVGAPYKRTVDDFFDVYFYGDFEKIERLGPDAYWEYTKETYEADARDIISYYEENGDHKALMEALREDCGENIRLSYKIVYEDELSERQLDGIKETLKTKYGIPRRSVKQAYELELEVICDGSEDTRIEKTEIIVVSIAGEWYVVSPKGEIRCYWNSEFY